MHLLKIIIFLIKIKWLRLNNKIKLRLKDQLKVQLLKSKCQKTIKNMNNIQIILVSQNKLYTNMNPFIKS
jgi:hypothetical protein